MVAFATTAGVRVFYSAIGADLCAQTNVIVGTSMFDTDAQAVANQALDIWPLITLIEASFPNRANPADAGE